MGSMSLFHWLIVLVVVMLLFGAGRLSEVGKGLGEGIKNFKKGLRDDDEPERPRRTAVEVARELMRREDRIGNQGTAARDCIAEDDTRRRLAVGNHKACCVV